MAGVRAALLILLLSLAACASAPAPADIPGPQIALAPADEAGRWRVSYTLDAPADSLDLVRVPDDARTRRWRAENPAFELVHRDGRDIIRRRDGQPFTDAAFTVEASYIPLLKDYAPFSPFGDGGLLIHSGRFFARPGGCDPKSDDCGPFAMRLTPPQGADVLVKGERSSGPVSWIDGLDGANIYVGTGEILDSPLFLAVIDATLPRRLREKLDTMFPELMRYYAQEMGALDARPMLFVSRGPGTADGGHGSQGGTLPGQVFMHFYGERDIAADIDAWVPWFFAHEAGHLFQKVRGFEEAESWLHEGGADAFALRATEDLNAASASYRRERREQAFSDCSAGLEAGPLREAGARGSFGDYYSCGLLMHLAAESAARRKPGGVEDIFGLWRAFLAEDSLDQAAFLRVVAREGDAETAEFLRRLADETLEKPDAVLAKGLHGAGLDLARFRPPEPG